MWRDFRRLQVTRPHFCIGITGILLKFEVGIRLVWVFQRRVYAAVKEMRGGYIAYTLVYPQYIAGRNYTL